MSGTFPTTKLPSRVQLSSVWSTRASATQSFKRVARTASAQRWAMKLTYPAMERATISELYAFLMQQQGAFDVFQLAAFPPYNVPRGSWAGTIVVDGVNAAGSRTLNLKGFTPSAANVALKMDLFTIQSDLKVYCIVGDNSADGAGLVTASIEPALIKATTDSLVITHTGVAFTMAQAPDANSLDIDAALHHGMTLDLVESV